MRSIPALLSVALLGVVGGLVLRATGDGGEQAALASASRAAPPQGSGAAPGDYVTSGKLHETCHKQQYTVWIQTLHAKQKADASAAADVKFRRMTGYDKKGDKAEQGVSCEACHGPGEAHMKAPLTKKKGTSLVPTRVEEEDPLAAVAICGQCHSQGAMPDGTKYPNGYVHGKNLPEGYKLAAAVAGGTRLRQLNDLQQSKHAEKGVTCVTCHTSHGGAEAKPQLRKPLNELCSACHAAYADMTHAKNATPQSKCSDCHMPQKRHVFKAPPET